MIHQLGDDGCFFQAAGLPGETAWSDAEIPEGWRLQAPCEDDWCTGIPSCRRCGGNLWVPDDQLPQPRPSFSRILRGQLYWVVCWLSERLPLVFPLHMWNVLDRSGAGSTRTKNALDSFHHTFDSLQQQTSSEGLLTITWCKLIFVWFVIIFYVWRSIRLCYTIINYYTHNLYSFLLANWILQANLTCF